MAAPAACIVATRAHPSPRAAMRRFFLFMPDMNETKWDGAAPPKTSLAELRDNGDGAAPPKTSLVKLRDNGDGAAPPKTSLAELRDNGDGAEMFKV